MEVEPVAFKGSRFMKRLLFIDSLRGLAAFAVVIYHFTTVYRHLYGHSFSDEYDFNYGNYGVELFFMISGFVIFFSFTKIKNGREFLFNRIIRLYPAYWLCMLVTFFCVQYFGLPGLETTFTDLLVNFTMFQKLVGVPDVDGVYWSLFSEWMFYLMMLVLFMSKKLDKILYVGVAWVILNFINIHIYQINYANRLLNLYHGVFFYSGILFYLFNTDIKNRKLILAHLTFTILVALSLYVHKSWTEVGIVAGIYVIFYLCISGRLDFLVNKVFLFLGTISYPLYLFHQNIGYIIIDQTKEFFGSSMLVIVPPILISVFSAYLITRYVEQPVLRYMKNWYNRNTGKSFAGQEKVVPSAFAKQETTPVQ